MCLRLVMGICFLVSVLTPTYPAIGESPNEQVRSIVSALSRREFDRALQLLQPALQSSPENAQLWMLQGLAYAGKGDPKQALNSYRSALKFSPDYVPALKGAAQLQFDARDRAAIPLLEHILRLEPKDYTSHAMLAVLAYNNGDCPSAVEHFAQSGSLLDSEPAAMQDYGVCLLRLKHTDQGIEVFQQILKLHPEDARARRGLAAVQLDAGKASDALTTLEPALRSEPDIDTMQLASAVYEANGDTPNAVKI